jgi:phosphatidylserine/phosphatidylglycerophosphate/cardiolipin synthase-like enzyme
MALNETNSAKSTMRWFLQKTEYDPRWCEFRYLVNGERAFGTLYQDLLNAKHSIDIICWGFQPSMYFVRKGQSLRIGELLAQKAEKDGVKVRLLCWHDPSRMSELSENNMPGFDGKLTATKHMLPDWLYRKVSISSPDYQTMEEAEFDIYWYWRASFNNVTNTIHKKTRDQLLDELSDGPYHLRDVLVNKALHDVTGFKNFELATRTFDASERQAIVNRLRDHGKQAGWSDSLIKGMSLGMGAWPTHHQKTVLIDYEYPDLAVGYVMGHNMLDQYWDTDEHKALPATPKTGRSGPSPWQDISSRVTGPVLQDINANFCQAWDEATGQQLTAARKKLGVEGKHELCLGGSLSGKGMMAQVLRTQSQHGKTDIGKLYLQALNNATQYVFVQNQYFRWDEFADTIKQTAIKHQKAGRDSGKDGSIYLFVITNASDAAVGNGTVTTYEMLESLGYGDRMPAVKYDETHDQLAARKASLQASLAKEQEVEQRMRTQGVDPASALGVMNYLQDSEIRQREMWAEIGDIEKQQKLLAQQGAQTKATKPGADVGVTSPGGTPALKVIVCTLVAPDSPSKDWVPVYVHAKTMIIDDAFTTLGSANINYRSMNVDSEINICLENGQVATGLRKELWELHTRGGKAGGETQLDSYAEDATGQNGLDKAFIAWTQIAIQNMQRRGKPAPPRASLVEFSRSSNSRSYSD